MGNPKRSTAKTVPTPKVKAVMLRVNQLRLMSILLCCLLFPFQGDTQRTAETGNTNKQTGARSEWKFQADDPIHIIASISMFDGSITIDPIVSSVCPIARYRRNFIAASKGSKRANRFLEDVARRLRERHGK
jgi:hypothetical protein